MLKQTSDNNSKSEEKALFIQRLGAFLIDMILISVVASLLVSPFVDSKKTEELQKDTTALLEKVQNENYSVERYTEEYSSIYYRIAKNNGLLSFFTIILSVLYYIVFQIYNHGQTIGKKIMKIKIVSDVGDLSMNQMIFRSFLANFILVDLIMFELLLFNSRKVYFYGSVFLEMIQYLITFVSIIMVMFRKDGCSIHDKLLHTKVVRVISK